MCNDNGVASVFIINPILGNGLGRNLPCELRVELNIMKSIIYKNVLIESDFISLHFSFLDRYSH